MQAYRGTPLLKLLILLFLLLELKSFFPRSYYVINNGLFAVTGPNLSHPLSPLTPGHLPNLSQLRVTPLVELAPTPSQHATVPLFKAKR
jgi:hypothetical protein